MDYDPINWYQRPRSTLGEVRCAPVDPSLPPPWKEVFDVATGRFYYWNTVTNVTQFDKPTYPTPFQSSYPFPYPDPVTSVPPSSALFEQPPHPSHFSTPSLPTSHQTQPLALPVPVVHDLLNQIGAIQQTITDVSNTCDEALRRFQERRRQFQELRSQWPGRTTPPTVISSAYSVHSNPHPSSTDVSNDVNLPFTHPHDTPQHHSSIPPAPHHTQTNSLHRKPLKGFRHRVVMAATRRVVKKTRKPALLCGVAKYSRCKMNRIQSLWVVKATTSFSPLFDEEFCQLSMGPTAVADMSPLTATNPSLPPIFHVSAKHEVHLSVAVAEEASFTSPKCESDDADVPNGTTHCVAFTGASTLSPELSSLNAALTTLPHIEGAYSRSLRSVDTPMSDDIAPLDCRPSSVVLIDGILPPFSIAYVVLADNIAPKMTLHGFSVVSLNSWYDNNVHLFMVLREILPTNGAIQSVVVYSLDCGIQPMNADARLRKKTGSLTFVSLDFIVLVAQNAMVKEPYVLSVVNLGWTHRRYDETLELFVLLRPFLSKGAQISVVWYPAGIFGTKINRGDYGMMLGFPGNVGSAPVAYVISTIYTAALVGSDIETSTHRDLVLDGLWDDSGGLKSITVTVTNLCQPRLVLKDFELLVAADHMLTDHEKSATVNRCLQLLYEAQNLFVHMQIATPALHYSEFTLPLLNVDIVTVVPSVIHAWEFHFAHLGPPLPKSDIAYADHDIAICEHPTSSNTWQVVSWTISSLLSAYLGSGKLSETENASITYQAVGVLATLRHSSPRITELVLFAGAFHLTDLPSSPCSECQSNTALLIVTTPNEPVSKQMFSLSASAANLVSHLLVVATMETVLGLLGGVQLPFDRLIKILKSADLVKAATAGEFLITSGPTHIQVHALTALPLKFDRTGAPHCFAFIQKLLSANRRVILNAECGKLLMSSVSHAWCFHILELESPLTSFVSTFTGPLPLIVIPDFLTMVLGLLCRTIAQSSMRIPTGCFEAVETSGYSFRGGPSAHYAWLDLLTSKVQAPTTINLTAASLAFQGNLSTMYSSAVVVWLLPCAVFFLKSKSGLPSLSGNYCSRQSCYLHFLNFMIPLSIESGFVAIECEDQASVPHIISSVPLQSNAALLLFLFSASIHFQPNSDPTVLVPLWALVDTWEVRDDGIAFGAALTNISNLHSIYSTLWDLPLFPCARQVVVLRLRYLRLDYNSGLDELIMAPEANTVAMRGILEAGTEIHGTSCTTTIDSNISVHAPTGTYSQCAKSLSCLVNEAFTDLEKLMQHVQLPTSLLYATTLSSWVQLVTSFQRRLILTSLVLLQLLLVDLFAMAPDGWFVHNLEKLCSLNAEQEVQKGVNSSYVHLCNFSDMIIEAKQARGMLSAAEFWAHFHCLAYRRPEDMPLFKGGGMLGLMSY